MRVNIYIILAILPLVFSQEEVSHKKNNYEALFDGSSIHKIGLYNYKYNGKTLIGKGDIRSKAMIYNNYEIRVRLKYVHHYSSLSIGVNKSLVPEPPLSKEEKLNWKGKWRNLHLSFRQVNNEQIRIENLNPIKNSGAELVRYFGGKLKLANTQSLEKMKLDERGYILDAPKNKSFLRFESEVEIASIEYRPLSPLSPRPFIQPKKIELKEMVVAGEKLYKVGCVTCHGDGIKKAPNPLARSFAKEQLQNGADLISLSKTIEKGFRNMPAMPNYTLEERYQLAHYLRETIFKVYNAKNVVDVKKSEMNDLPHPLYSYQEQQERKNINSSEKKQYEEGRLRDFGPAMVSVNGKHRNAMQVKLSGNTTLSYNLNTMETIGLWHGSFMDMRGSHYYKAKGNIPPKANGTFIPELKKWRWAHEGKMNYAINNKSGPLNYKGFRWHGHYVYDNKVVLSYKIDGRNILEQPECFYNPETNERVIVQYLEIGPGDTSLLLGLSDVEGVSGPVNSEIQKVGKFNIQCLEDVEGLTWENHLGLALSIPKSKVKRKLTIVRYLVSSSKLFSKINISPKESRIQIDQYPHLIKEKQKWRQSYGVKGQLSKEKNSTYVVDTIPVPFENKWNSWMRTTSLGFFNDGRLAVTTYDGDVWLVTGLDEKLENVVWKRYAAGLHEAFGCEVVDGKLIVSTRNGLVRLHDYNEDDEADYYEQFFADPDFSLNYHGYNFDLVKDNQGYLYYAKSGQFNDNKRYPNGGCFKISPDGKNYSLLGTGFRTPNGMGMLPDGRVLMADNQGSRIPASKISILKAGKYYGGGRQLKEFEQPILWMPQNVDNSSGGQVWIKDHRFGPYGKDHLLHTSCGSGKAMMVFLDEYKDITQAAVTVFPFKFKSGVMRARVNPKDGQVYLTGTRGWGVSVDEDGCLQRIRYTGKKNILITGAKARKGVLEISFNQDVAVKKDSVEVSMWNYKYSHAYGSKNYSVRTGDVGVDKIEVNDVLTKDKKMKVMVPGLLPANQVKVSFKVNGESWDREVYYTIHKL